MFPLIIGLLLNPILSEICLYFQQQQKNAAIFLVTVPFSLFIVQSPNNHIFNCWNAERWPFNSFF